MVGPPQALSYELHKLSARLDRAADGLLRDRYGVSYARFLALFAVSQGARTQRAVARWLGQSEPSTSRMVGVLVDAGWMDAGRTAGAGNRRDLTLTAAGTTLVTECTELLEGRFTELVSRAGVSFGPYQRSTRLLLAQLEADERDRGRFPVASDA